MVNSTESAENILALPGTSNSKPDMKIEIEVKEPIWVMEGRIKGSTDSEAFQSVIRKRDIGKVEEVYGSAKPIGIK